jgi:hypothetical protein
MAQSHHQHHPILHVVHDNHKTAELVDRRFGQADLGRTTVQMVSGGKAFREYSALSNEVGMNYAGNLRGMVVSAKWRMIFNHVSRAGEYMENIGYLAAISAGIAESAPRIDAIYHSSDSPALKGMKISSIAGTIAQRALLGVVPTGAHLIYRSLEGWCMIAGLAGGRTESLASQGIRTLSSADTLVQTTFRTITDTTNQANAVWSVVDFTTLPRNQKTP